MQIAVPRGGFSLKICNVNSRPKESPDPEKLKKKPSRNRIVHIITSYAKCNSSRGSLAFLYLGSPQGEDFSFQISIKIDLSLRVFFLISIFPECDFDFFAVKIAPSRGYF